MLALKSQNFTTDTIDGVIISHFHGDHFGGLPYLLLDANFNQQRTAPFHIMGPPGISDRVEALLEASYPKVAIGSLGFEVHFEEFEHLTKQDFGPFQLEAIPVVHVPESNPHGIRLYYQQSLLSFSGDTGWTENLYQIADGAHLFVCECNFFETEMPSHLNYRKIVKERDNLKCERIILNHLGAEMLDNLSLVDLQCGEDGMTLEL